MRMTRTPPEDRRRLTGGAESATEGDLKAHAQRKQNASVGILVPRGLAHATHRPSSCAYQPHTTTSGDRWEFTLAYENGDALKSS